MANPNNKNVRFIKKDPEACSDCVTGQPDCDGSTGDSCSAAGLSCTGFNTGVDAAVDEDDCLQVRGVVGLAPLP